ncbi:hypothetical protein CLU79DRAFT_728803 [Phycomyces nitens]|nr:hypothetical protein CLU79DRAFT_728803 [Phycomyces nitens]
MAQIDKSFKNWLKKVTLNPARKTLGSSNPDTRVFGVQLELSIRYAQSTISYFDTARSTQPQLGAIPIIVSRCGAFLKQNALHTVGVFRLSGSSRRIQVLQDIFDKPSTSYGAHIDWHGFTVHDIATLLRRYLNHLPNPVITHEYYKPFCDIMHNRTYTTTDQRITAFRSLIRKLPLAHQHLLLYLLDMLNVFAQNSCVNRMDASNLAAMFCPAILSHPSQNTPISYVVSQRVIEFLIEFHSLFGMQTISRRKSSRIRQSSSSAFARIITVSNDKNKSNTVPALRRRRPATLEINLIRTPMYSPESLDGQFNIGTIETVHKAEEKGGLITPRVSGDYDRGSNHVRDGDTSQNKTVYKLHDAPVTILPSPTKTRPNRPVSLNRETIQLCDAIGNEMNNFPKHKNNLTIDTNLQEKLLSQSTISLSSDIVVGNSIGSSTDLSASALTDEISLEDTDSLLEMSLKEDLAREEQLMQDEEVMFQWRDLLTRSWRTDESTPKIPLTSSSSICSKRTDYFGHASSPKDDRSGSHTSTPSRFLEEDEYESRVGGCKDTWDKGPQQAQSPSQRTCQDAFLAMNIRTKDEDLSKLSGKLCPSSQFQGGSK